MTPFNQDRTGKRDAGFTLVELLVVVAILALLVGILLPALSRSREMSRELLCLSNLRQLNAAGAAYAESNDDMYPIAPCYIAGADGRAAKDSDPNAARCYFDSWDYGGKTVSDFWKPLGLNQYRTCAQRALNPLIADDELIDPPKSRKELYIYRCPSDPGSLQRDFYNHPPYNDPTVTCYDDVGTSYQINVRWWYVVLAAAGNPSKNVDLWRSYKGMFRNASFAAPSRFAWLYDQNMDFVANSPYSHVGDHGGQNMACAGFMDGHAKYTNVQQGQPDTVEYTLLVQKR